MIDSLDHLVLTTSDMARCERFYVEVLGMTLETFTGGEPAVMRKALRFGRQKINLHEAGKEFEPKAHHPTPGALDLCFLATVPLAQVMETLRAKQWPIEVGPVRRTGATGPIESIYVRDPDRNLIEISRPID